MTTRRRILVLLALGSSAFGSIFPAYAQQPAKGWRIGYLAHGTRAANLHRLAAFTQALRDLGYFEGKNLLIEWRFSDGNDVRVQDMAAELARLKVDAIVCQGTLTVRAAQKATRAIPIIAIGVGNPVGTGFAASLARPGGNITGLSVATADVIPKRLQLRPRRQRDLPAQRDLRGQDLSREQSRATFPSSSPPGSTLRSTGPPPKRSALRFPRS